MSENTFDDFDFDMEPMPGPLPTLAAEPKPDQTPKPEHESKSFVQDDADLAPIKGLDALDNVVVDIPAVVHPKQSESDTKTDAASKHQKDVLTEMISNDVEGQAEIQKLMSDRRALSRRLQEDPEFDKRYKKAESDYFARVNGEQPKQDNTVPNDDLFKQAQVLVERLHNKTANAEPKPDQNSDQKPESNPAQTSDQDPSDPHGLSRFGTVSQDVPEEPSDSDSEELLTPKRPKSSKSESKGKNKIVIHNVKKLVINFNL